MVELLRRYRNRTDVSSDLARVIARLEAPVGDVADQSAGDLTSASPSHRLLALRFTPEQITAMLNRIQDGATFKEVAAEFRIGMTSLKRLVRSRRARS
jgi:hypothetical protein